MSKGVSRIYDWANGEPPQGAEAKRRNRAIAKAAWHQLGLVVLDLDDVLDDWTRQAIRNEAVNQYGERGQ